ncbi:cell cycle regulator of non-homologous end joining isoform X1 [Oryctolagus cuniculus]|uniref:cell cycle regulator of non-homologous end joining isoform X1 n=1 Tax=Oryctolagus cuniculus TaxID=9986 RepID=UPI00387A4474
MEDLASGTKKRVLPSWMTAQAVEKRKAPVHTPKRRRMAAVAMARPTRRTVYCMNETELVDVALGILIEVSRYTDAGKHRTPPGVTRAAGAAVSVGGRTVPTCWPLLTKRLSPGSRPGSDWPAASCSRLPRGLRGQPRAFSSCTLCSRSRATRHSPGNW